MLSGIPLLSGKACSVGCHAKWDAWDPAETALPVAQVEPAVRTGARRITARSFRNKGTSFRDKGPFFPEHGCVFQGVGLRSGNKGTEAHNYTRFGCGNAAKLICGSTCSGTSLQRGLSCNATTIYIDSKRRCCGVTFMLDAGPVPRPRCCTSTSRAACRHTVSAPRVPL
jgi:hypothetical protein